MKCSFCAKPKDDVQALIMSRSGSTICNECVSVCVVQLLTRLKAQPLPGEVVAVAPPTPIGGNRGH